VGERRRLRDLFLQPWDDIPARPTPEELADMPRADRRVAKLRYQARAGLFRTWVYPVALVLLVGGFALYLVLAT
jgi:hypothetical protein